MPVLAGQVVESAEASDRFLWDFRKTIADLIANEHYGQLEDTLHERGMGHYGESHEGGRAFVADGMEVKKFNEIPMSAMWTQTARRQQRRCTATTPTIASRRRWRTSTGRTLPPPNR